jgi:hypothetical protein
MPHDKNGNQLSVGDEVTLRCRITQITPSETECNVTAEAIERPEGEGYVPSIACNSKFYVKDIGTPPDARTGHKFGYAVEALKNGHRVCREGWNGKGMFLFLLPAADGLPTKIIHDPALRQVIEDKLGGETFDALGSVRMFTADKKILTGWLASQTDMLSEDWEILD